MSGDSSRLRSSSKRIGALLFAIGIVGLLMLRLLKSPESVVKLRNSLLASVAVGMTDFTWSPGAEPEGYLLERGVPPADFGSTVRNVFASVPQGTAHWDEAIFIARHLVGLKQKGDPVLRTVPEAYRLIVEHGRGYCSDFTQVFNALAITAGIPVREWGMAFEGFGGGHAFNEVYDQRLAKWVFIDSYYSFYVVDEEDGTPISALDFRERLLAGSGARPFRLERIAAGRFGFADDAEALAYYRRGADQFFLWWGNNVFDYDSHPVVHFLGPFSRAAEQAGAILAGVHPKIRIVPSASNAPMADALSALRVRFILLVLIGMLSCALLVVEAWRLRRALRRWPVRR